MAMKFIYFQNQLKTQCETIIKLPDYIIAILKKYKSQKGYWLLPRYNNVILNKYIKRLAERAGFTSQIYKARDKRGLENEIIIKSNSKVKNYRFCDLITTHTMRRTAITTMLCLGMPEHIVRKISGHAPGSKNFIGMSHLHNIIRIKRLK
jgi:integrase